MCYCGLDHKGLLLSVCSQVFFECLFSGRVHKSLCYTSFEHLLSGVLRTFPLRPHLIHLLLNTSSQASFELAFSVRPPLSISSQASFKHFLSGLLWAFVLRPQLSICSQALLSGTVLRPLSAVAYTWYVTTKSWVGAWELTHIYNAC